MSDTKLTGHILQRDGFTLDARKIAEAHAKLFRLLGPPAAHQMCKLLTAYLQLAVEACNTAERIGCKTSRTEMGKAAMDYMKALAEGADQLFAQVKAKGN